MPFIEKAETLITRFDSPNTIAEVNKVDCKFYIDKAAGVDEISCEYIKSLDVVGLFWLTSLYDIAWSSVIVTLDLMTRVVVPVIKKSLDQLYTLTKVIEGLWEFAQLVHMCFWI